MANCAFWFEPSEQQTPIAEVKTPHRFWHLPIPMPFGPSQQRLLLGQPMVVHSLEVIALGSLLFHWCLGMAQEPEALTIVKMYLLALMALSGFGVLRYVMHTHRLNLTGADARFELRAMTQMRILCATLGWFLYFEQSLRVPATFSENI
jgi:hypothetical protein